MNEEKRDDTCPFCLEKIKNDAKICPHCRILLKDFKICPKCSERILLMAFVCRYCGFDLYSYEKEQRIRAGIEKPSDFFIHLSASPLGAMLTESSITALFFPPEIQINSREILIKKWTLLGLRTTNQKISIHKIASVRFIKGIIWGGIIFETYGGGVPELVINGLDKKEALSLKQSLDKLLFKISTETKK